METQEYQSLIEKLKESCDEENEIEEGRVQSYSGKSFLDYEIRTCYGSSEDDLHAKIEYGYKLDDLYEDFDLENIRFEHEQNIIVTDRSINSLKKRFNELETKFIKMIFIIFFYLIHNIILIYCSIY